MLLWDREMASARSQIERLTPAQRYAIAVRTIEKTLASLDPPLGDSSAAQLLRHYLDKSRAAVGGDYTGRKLPEDVVEKMSSIVGREEDAEPGVAPLILAVANCYSLPESGMETEHLYTVLNDSYAAVVDHEELEEGTLEEELANPRCISIIAMQKELIAG
jgi:hypothetical protein